MKATIRKSKSVKVIPEVTMKKISPCRTEVAAVICRKAGNLTTLKL